MAQGLVDERTEEDGSHLVEDRRPNQAVDDVPYDLQGRCAQFHNIDTLGQE